MTLESDIGKVVVKTLDDPRAENKRVVIKANEASQLELVATWEKISGKTITQNKISAEDFRKADEGSRAHNVLCQCRSFILSADACCWKYIAFCPL